MKEYYRSIRGDKPAGVHEQAKVCEVLGCEIEKGKIVNNEQMCTLKRETGSDIQFIIRDNLDGTKHAEIIVAGKAISININSENKNDCFYNVALVANEMSEASDFDTAMKKFDDKDAVKNLRMDASLAVKNDENVLKELRWTNRTDISSHFNSLTGVSVINGQFIADVSDV